MFDHVTNCERITASQVSSNTKYNSNLEENNLVIFCDYYGNFLIFLSYFRNLMSELSPKEGSSDLFFFQLNFNLCFTFITHCSR